MRLDWFRQLAAYNQWANARLYGEALAMPDALYRQEVGVFFKSLHGTLNHLLVADRIWLKRLTGQGEVAARLDVLVFDDRIALARARQAEDARIIALVASYREDSLDEDLAYSTVAGAPQQQRIADILLHFFNHQTHHRGQAHACCSIVTGREPPSLDLLQFQRGVPAPDLKL